MRRRMRIRTQSLLFACMLIAGGFVSVGGLAEPPNIIFLMADDMGYGDAGCFGQKLIQTPHIDRLAREGMRFTQCYAGSTVCAPSRSVLMTGKHTGHTTVRGNFGVGGVTGLGGGKGRVPLREEDVTIAEVMKSAGYVTGMTGKWGLGEPNTSGEPNSQGFDEWFGYLNQRRAHTYYPDFVWLNQGKYDLPGNRGGAKQQYTHDLFAGFALNFIRRHAEERFFLYLPFTVPHSRFEIPDVGPYEKKDWTQQEKVYAAMISRMDDHLGMILETLDQLDLRERTLIFFCSDNGAADRYEGRFESSGVLRGRKRDLFEGGLRTPMIARWPGSIPANKINESVWYFADVLPTLAELAGVVVPSDIDGMSCLPMLKGREMEQLNDRFLYWEFFERGFQQAARWRHWKAIRMGVDEPLQLFDLVSDLGETRDVAEEHPAIIAKFEAYLKTARTESVAFPRRRER